MSIYKRVNELLGLNYKSDEEIDWFTISSGYNLSEEFIEEFSGYVVWSCISLYQALSLEFIEKHENYVDWSFISESQILSWNFILKHKNRLNWGKISEYQPYIDPEYYMINKNKLKLNGLLKLYQETKDRGWFFGYMEDYNNYNPYYYYSFYILSSYCKKVRIYWKDLASLCITKNYELIRKVKYV